MEPTTDATLQHTIKELVDEEEALYARPSLDDRAMLRLEEIKVELDRLWDLLRQRRALREFGRNPNDAKLRPASVVEKYEQ